MSVKTDLDDTVSLRCDFASPPAPRGSLLHDTNRFRRSGPETRASHTDGEVHPYAEGIIRFYRARTILGDRAAGAAGADVAWPYLEKLSPHELPASTRWHFIELVYFMQHVASGSEGTAAEFRKRVLAIADLIDAFVELMNSRADTTGGRAGKTWRRTKPRA